MSSLISPFKQGEAFGGSWAFQSGTTQHNPQFSWTLLFVCEIWNGCHLFLWQLAAAALRTGQAWSGEMSLWMKMQMNPLLWGWASFPRQWLEHWFQLPACIVVTVASDVLVKEQHNFKNKTKQKKAFAALIGEGKLHSPPFDFFLLYLLIPLTVLLLMDTCCRYSYLLFSACMLKQCLLLSSSYKGFCELSVLHILWSLTCSAAQEKGWVIFKGRLEKVLGRGLRNWRITRWDVLKRSHGGHFLRPQTPQVTRAVVADSIPVTLLFA